MIHTHVVVILEQLFAKYNTEPFKPFSKYNSNTSVLHIQMYMYMTVFWFKGRNHDLIDRYGITVSQMTTDMFHVS